MGIFAQQQFELDIAICIIIYLAYGVKSLDICGFMPEDFNKCYVKLSYLRQVERNFNLPQI